MGAALAVCLDPAAPSVAAEDDEFEPNPENPTVAFTIEGGVSGSFTVEIFLDRVPLTASNFLDLCQTGFYDGLHFHRVIPNFMAQFGCPRSRDPSDQLAGTGGPPDGSTFTNITTGEAVVRQGGCIADEHISEDSNDVGTLSMANTGEPNTGGSQIFLNVADNYLLDWFSDGADQHVVFGRITSGLDVLIAVSKAAVVDDRIQDDADRRPLMPIRVTRLTVANLAKPNA